MTFRKVAFGVRENRFNVPYNIGALPGPGTYEKSSG